MAKHRSIVAALSGKPETGLVLRTALGVAQMMGMAVEAVHVTDEEGGARESAAIAHANGARVHHRKGEVAAQILKALESHRVFGAVMGARSLIAGRRPMGSTALEVLRATSKPVVFVPPGTALSGGFVPRRLLMPVDGSAAVSSTILGVEGQIRPDADVDMIILYVLDGLTPTMVDHPEHDLSDWGKEFVLRYCPGEHRSFEWRLGDPGDAVVDVAEQSESDLVVLCFRGDIEAGHGAVVREVLARSPVPVLVLPTSQCAYSTARRRVSTSRG
jgi:nucleotide-binding universal stress UspA family protein